MLAKILSGAVIGVDGYIVQVEVDLARGLPVFSTVGLPEGAVRESKDRVKAAIKNCGYDFPARRITVNLAPASVKKEGAGYDLPIALGILAASGTLQCAELENFGAVGELSLDGTVCPVRGILPMILAARKEGIKRFFVPMENSEEAAVVKGIEIIAVGRLDETVEVLVGVKQIIPSVTDIAGLFCNNHEHSVDFAEVNGQEYAKRAMEVAAAGGHNILLNGAPGTGKTMMARRLTTILPALRLEEALETTKVYSTTGLLPEKNPLMVSRPFRSPHHTISNAGLIGGGQVPRPGEVSLAHNGVLFLDELPEFRKNVLEVMRQPLEDGVVTISRASSSLQFPARFMLVAAMNPCPCGYYGDSSRECVCSPIQIQRYQGRLSVPLLDRIDMHIEVPPVKVKEIDRGGSGVKSAVIRERVNAARQLQNERYINENSVYCNAQMNSAMMKKYCQLDSTSTAILHRSVELFGLSARAYYRILKIARTIADLDHESAINTKHVTEAVQYRRLPSANI
jgi:magnesium chelatase family protein